MNAFPYWEARKAIFTLWAVAPSIAWKRCRSQRGWCKQCGVNRSYPLNTTIRCVTYLNWFHRFSHLQKHTLHKAGSLQGVCTVRLAHKQTASIVSMLLVVSSNSVRRDAPCNAYSTCNWCRACGFSDLYYTRCVCWKITIASHAFYLTIAVPVCNRRISCKMAGFPQKKHGNSKQSCDSSRKWLESLGCYGSRGDLTSITKAGGRLRSIIAGNKDSVLTLLWCFKNLGRKCERHGGEDLTERVGLLMYDPFCSVHR